MLAHFLFPCPRYPSFLTRMRMIIITISITIIIITSNNTIIRF